MAGRHKPKAGIVALEKTGGACTVVTFSFPAQSVGGSLVTLTLCEWQRVAQQIAEATAAIAR